MDAFGGEGGIWTLAPVTRPTPLAGEPLHHLSTSPNWWLTIAVIVEVLAEGKGFEPLVPFGITSFQD